MPNLRQYGMGEMSTAKMTKCKQQNDLKRIGRPECLLQN